MEFISENELSDTITVYMIKIEEQKCCRKNCAASLICKKNLDEKSLYITIDKT